MKNHILLYCLFITLQVSANLFVAPNGSDNHKGSIMDPFASVTYASTKARPGDTVYIRGGGYHIKEQIILTTSGTPGKWIVYMPFPGEKVSFNVDLIPWPAKVQGEKYTPTVGAFQIEKCSFIKVLNIGIRYSHRAGFIVRNSHHIELNHCIVDNTYNSAIGLWYSDSVKVVHCDVSQANDLGKRMPFDKLGREAPHEAISIAGSTNFEVAYNHVHLCYKEGIDCKEVSAHGKIHHNYVHDNSRQGIYVDAWFGLLEDIDVYENIVFNCENGIGIGVECDSSQMQNVRVHHNIIFDNRGSGIILGVWGKNGPRKNIQIFNNTICFNGSPSHWSGATGGIDLRSSNISEFLIANNICYKNYAYEIATSFSGDKAKEELRKRNIEIDNNWVSDTRIMPLEEGIFNPVYSFTGTSEMHDNPMFVDEATKNFRLKENSPARNKARKINGYAKIKTIGAIEN